MANTKREGKNSGRYILFDYTTVKEMSDEEYATAFWLFVRNLFQITALVFSFSAAEMKCQVVEIEYLRRRLPVKIFCSFF